MSLSLSSRTFKYGALVDRETTKTFLLKPTPAGQVGLFPEQVKNWEWIESASSSLEGLKALNLFGYTGGTTLALASRGVAVTHVDAARNVVKWARQNAVASGLDQRPIRWIVEDALKFVRREIKRGATYDILVADPPTYGKGPKKERWVLSDDLESLAAGLSLLSNARPKMLLITCHTPGVGLKDLDRIMGDHFDFESSPQLCQLGLETSSGKKLASGIAFRYGGSCGG